MRKTLLALLILILPSTVALVVYISVTRRAPTNRDAVGQVITIAGAGYPGKEDGPGKAAAFGDPFGIAVDYRGNVIVADGGQSNCIRIITQDGKVSTIAGSDQGFRDGDALGSQFDTPSGVAVDKQGNIFIADTSNNRIRKLSADGRTVSTVAGSGASGSKDGPAGEAEFDGPIGIAVDRKGNIFVADTYNDSIRRISVEGNVTTIAGGGIPGYVDGQAASALFDTPCGVVEDTEGNLYVADTGNRAIRKITETGEVTTVPVEHAESPLDRPVGLVVTHDKFLFIADEGRGRIVRVTPEGKTSVYAGSGTGFADGVGAEARFSGVCGLAIDRQGNLYSADTHNYLVREIFPAQPRPDTARDASLFVQPMTEPPEMRQPIPILDKAALSVGDSIPWPLLPQDQWHEITGVLGEARGAPGGVALDHIHSGLDMRGNAGEPVVSIFSEKVSSPIANWGFDGASEGITVGLFSYIHIRVGRNSAGEFQAPEKFKPRIDPAGKLIGVRVRRGTRFATGDFVGSVNRLNHVHLNLGPWNAQSNPLRLPFFGLKDTVAPTIEQDGIEVLPASAVPATAGGKGGKPFSERRNGRLMLSGDVAILVTAFDRVDGNGANRKLGLYKLGYQLLSEDGSPVRGFDKPVINIEFNNVPPEDSSVFKVYSSGSGVSAYGTPTKFKYIVTNRVRDGEAIEGFLRTSSLASGNYIIRIIAEDYAGNRASGKSAELPIAIVN